jgi:ketosteroid isomerase-like protein
MQDEIDKIIALEHQRCQAELHGDSDAFERLLDDSLVHVHTGGRIDGKAALIAARKKVKFLALTRRDLQVRTDGDLAVLTGGMYFQVQALGSDRVVTSDVFVTQVLTRRNGQWRFILYQATARPT